VQFSAGGKLDGSFEKHAIHSSPGFAIQIDGAETAAAIPFQKKVKRRSTGIVEPYLCFRSATNEHTVHVLKGFRPNSPRPLDV